MNNLPKWKMFLIKLIAGNEPVLLNFAVFRKHIPVGMHLIYISAQKEVRPCKYYEDRAFLVPSRNIID